MAKQVKLQKNGEVVYPQTITDAVAYKTDSESTILTDKLKGIDSDIADIEFSQLRPSLTASPTSKDVLFGAGVSQNVSLTLGASKAINADNHFSDTSISYRIGATGEFTKVNGTTATVAVTADSTPSSKSVYASGTAKYRGSKTVTFGSTANPVSTINFVRRSYIGYVDAASTDAVAAVMTAGYNSTSGAITGMTSKVAKNVATNSFEYSTPAGKAAYFVVAIPKASNVFGVSQITQLGTLNAVQTTESKTATIGGVSYQLYVCKSKHNAGTYNFKITTNGTIA